MSVQIEILVERVKQHDQLAFRQLYMLLVQSVYAYVLRFLKSPALADDAVQEVFIKVWERRATLDPSKSFKSYTFTIAKHQVLDMLLQAARDQKILDLMIPEALEGLTTNNMVALQEVQSVLQEAVEQLPPQQKRVFELCKTQGLSYEQAANQLNITAGTVNSQMVNILRSLRSYLSSRGYQTLLVLLVHYESISLLLTQ